MEFQQLKTAFYTCPKFEGMREFYIIEDKKDLKKLVKCYPILKRNFVMSEKIRKILLDGYVVIVSDINKQTRTFEIYYENIIPTKYTYDNAFHRVNFETLSNENIV